MFTEERHEHILNLLKGMAKNKKDIYKRTL